MKSVDQMGKIVEIPFSRDLIEFIAEELIKEEGHDFSSTLVVFTHKRPVLYLRRMMAERLNSPFFPPETLSMDEFMASLAAKVSGDLDPINSLDSAYLLFQAVAKIPGNPWQESDSFNQFLFWGLKLDRVIEELDVEMVEDESLKGIQMGDLWEPNVARSAGILMDHLAEIRRIYHALLEERNLTTRGRDYAIAAGNIERIDLGSFKEIYLAGIFAMTRAEKVIIRNLLRQPGVNLIRQNDGTKWTPFEEVNSWGVEIEHRAQSTEPIQGIYLHKAFNTHSEVVGLRDILIDEGVADPEKTAIVLPEPEPLIPLLSEVMTTLSIDYNISMGYPLIRTPVYALLDLFIRLQRTKRESLYYLSDYLSFLMHPYIKNIHHRIESTYMRILIHSVEEALLGQSRTFIGLDEIEERLDIFEEAAQMTERRVPIEDLRDALSEIHDIFVRKMEGVKTLGQLGGSFEEILAYLIKESPAAGYPFSGEFFHRFFLLLDKIKDSLIRDERFDDPRDLFDLFGHLVKGEYIPFAGIPLKGLQILGILETRALKFDKVFLLSANEGILPSVESFDSLLPLPLRSALGIPAHYENEEIYHYHFHHLVSSAKEVHIFYLETEKEFRSRFVERLIWEEEKRRGHLGALEIRPVELNVSLALAGGFEVAKGPQVLDLLGKTSFSVSALNAYLNCPAQFYFERVLGLKEKEDVPAGLDAADIGNILHKVMELLYRPFAGQGILGEDGFIVLEKNLAGVLEDVFLETFGEIRGEDYLLKEMALKRLLAYIRREREDFANKIKIVSTEQELSCSLSLEDGTTVALRGRVDRIDYLSEEYMITDYKSGKDLNKYSFRVFDKVYTCRDEMKDEIRSLQLPFYVLLYQRASLIPYSQINSRLISLQTKETNTLFDGEIDREEFLEDTFLPSIKNLIGEILDPRIPFVADVRGEECLYCPFPTFCRKR